MIRQLNVKRQLTIPAPLAKRIGLSGKGWVDVSERGGTLIILPLNLEAERATPLRLSDADWRALNREVRRELRAGKGTIHADPQAFLRDLKRRISGKGGPASE